ncbi:DNA binding protein [Arthrobacter phage Bauer]|uniref:DNA binding protein n=1 Tax=Arthrobacter phage Bauer TaxID=2985648 RepID=A0A9E8A9W8_9CAUD|nr:DNA binding protein [Arthrobacter phage Bauer]UYM26597.1 DNA binding protein [Arthrobacter phage Bauer]
MKAAVFEDNEWLEDAVATIVGLSLAQEEFTADDLRREMREPAHPNWPGQAFSVARSRGYIEAVSHSISSARSRKNGSLRTWTRKKEVAA